MPSARREGRPEIDSPERLGADVRFTDVTAEAGVDVVYHNGREAGHNSILESLGGGAAMLDYDGDGLLDLFFTGGGRFQNKDILGRPSVLYRNDRDGRFREVTTEAGDGFPARHYTHGAFAADYDNDGFPDLLVTGYGGLQLWHNQGDGTFLERRIAAGLTDEAWSSAAGWGDVNGDGSLDLYVAHYVNWSFENHPHCQGPRPGQVEICSPRAFDGLPDTLYLSNGDGTFRNASAEAGLVLESGGVVKDGAKGLGVVMGDLDDDGDIDIYVANDTTENYLYLNDGAGRFEEVAALRGAAVDERGTPNGSMGVDLGDYNRDGQFDIWVANFEIESFALYRNDGDGLFLHVSQPTGVTALNGLFVGFGTAFVDLNRDGYEDLVVANGHVINYPKLAPLLQEPLILVNQEGRRFLRLEPDVEYFRTPHAGRGLAVGDLDNDGDADLVFSNNHEPAAVLQNDSRDEGQWVRVRLIGRRSNRDAIGAVLTLDTSAGDQVRMIKGGGSYLSQNDLRPLWGVPPGATIEHLKIRWPSGEEQVVDDLRAGETLTVVQTK